MTRKQREEFGRFLLGVGLLVTALGALIIGHAAALWLGTTAHGWASPDGALVLGLAGVIAVLLGALAMREAWRP